ncbi:MAG: hypothetical protein IRY98_07365, partial [Alicyclobacillaceae bacterium]|nr:hypothetical protein [Alicyclobacillaceae bacterium]
MKSASALCIFAALALVSFALMASGKAADDGSPAEPRIAVLRQGAVWVWQPGARFAPVPHSEGADRASFSPDGRFLAVHKRIGELWLVDLRGGRSWLVAKDRVEPEIAWAPAGSRLAYIRGHSLWVVPCGPAGPVDWGMAAPEAEQFAWSDDGSRLFVATSAWSPPPAVTPPAPPAPPPPAPAAPK